MLTGWQSADFIRSRRQTGFPATSGFGLDRQRDVRVGICSRTAGHLRRDHGEHLRPNRVAEVRRYEPQLQKLTAGLQQSERRFDDDAIPGVFRMGETTQARSYIGTRGRDSSPQMDASPQTSHLQFFLHINFPAPVSLDAQMLVIT